MVSGKCVESYRKGMSSDLTFLTNEPGNCLLDRARALLERNTRQIEAFIEMLGADARLLTDGEEIKSHDLFQLFPRLCQALRQNSQPVWTEPRPKTS